MLVKYNNFQTYKSDYSENILVQESAGNLLRDELDWDVQFAYNTEVLGKDCLGNSCVYCRFIL